MSEISEADKTRLQYARDTAEHEKVLLETQALRRESAWPARALEMLKSAVVLVGGIITLGIGSKLAELKKQQLDQEIEAGETKKQQLTGEQQALKKRNAEYKDAISSAERKVQQVTVLTGRATQRLDSLQRLAAGTADSRAVLATVNTELRRLRQSFAAIDQNVGDASVDLQAAKPAVQPVATAAGVAPLAEQVEGLFAPTAGRRGAAYQALMSYYATDPNLVPTLIKRATADPKNLNGLYNALVVLGHLSPLPPGTDVGAVREFALANRGKGPRIAGRVDKVLERLPGPAN